MSDFPELPQHVLHVCDSVRMFAREHEQKAGFQVDHGRFKVKTQARAMPHVRSCPSLSKFPKSSPGPSVPISLSACANSMAE